MASSIEKEKKMKSGIIAQLRIKQNWLWSIKNSGEVLSKLKCRGFRATSLSTYDFSTLYTTLPHNLIKEKLLDLIEWTFKRALKSMVHFVWHVMTKGFFHFL